MKPLRQYVFGVLLVTFALTACLVICMRIKSLTDISLYWDMHKSKVPWPGLAFRLVDQGDPAAPFLARHKALDSIVENGMTYYRFGEAFSDVALVVVERDDRILSAVFRSNSRVFVFFDGQSAEAAQAVSELSAELPPPR